MLSIRVHGRFQERLPCHGSLCADKQVQLYQMQFPLSKIDTDAVKSIPGTGNAAFAVGASSKLVEKVNATLQAGAIGKIYAQILAPVSGTVVVLGQSGGQPGDTRSQRPRADRRQGA